MQGTVALLLALSGLGCHHKSCATYAAPACYAAPTSYSGCGGCGGGTAMMPATFAAPMYGGDCAPCGYSSCGTPRKCGWFGGWRSRCGNWAIQRCSLGSYNWDAGYSLPVYGSYTPAVVYGGYGSGQYYSSGQVMGAPVSSQVYSAPAASTPTTTSPYATTPAAAEPAAVKPADTTPPPADPAPAPADAPKNEPVKPNGF